MIEFIISFKVWLNFKILIESKLYRVPVNSRQIEKFYADLDRTGMNFGIFISLTSGISNRKRLEYENYNGKHILFLPNAGFEGLNIVYSVLFFKTLFKYLNTETNPNKNIITVNEFNKPGASTNISPIVNSINGVIILSCSVYDG